MINFVIVAVLAFVIYYAIRFSANHIKGRGKGSSDEAEIIIPRKELSGRKIGEKHVSIDGMHSKKCVRDVTVEINKIRGASAKVSLEDSEAVVSYDREVSDNDIKKAVQKAGCEVVGIS